MLVLIYIGVKMDGEFVGGFFSLGWIRWVKRDGPSGLALALVRRAGGGREIFS